ncbi:MAG TPA: FAD-dependent oxidoreductase [Saprospiraceae bacterium]|nr:FAD-dependent oxidoreductase [Saprospiraceae bacterium]HND87754.1 FAD-dependent oxidoreductase [Saprospiraceae bacterium]HNG88614.1 FAD-dependent oxidoreductase [Saprospiraceae bacterium]
MLWYQPRVRQIADLSPGVRQFWLEFPEVEHFEFRAGQFLTFDLPIGEKRLQRWRSYSIASPPDGSNVVELCVVRSASGEGTRYLFEEVREGSTLRCKGPDGGFVLPDLIERDLVFVCTGTGVAPFRSMLLDLKNSGRAHRGLHLIFGTRREQDILYRADFEALAREWPQFRYDVALSRQPEWPGHKGRVHAIYQQHYTPARPDVAFFLCGWTQMIDEAVAHLVAEMRYSPKQVLYELYG